MIVLKSPFSKNVNFLKCKEISYKVILKFFWPNQLKKCVVHIVYLHQYYIDIGILLSKILFGQHDNKTLFVATTRQCHDNCHEVETDPTDHFYCILK